MRDDRRNRYLTRSALLQRLTDEEVQSVTAAETSERLVDGDVYLDLTRLEQGVRRSRGDTTLTRPVLPKKAFEDTAWKNIVQHLAVLEAASRSSKT